MPNQSEVDDVEGEIIEPLAKFLFTDEELNEYLEDFVNFEDKDSVVPIRRYTHEICGPADSGKTHQVCMSWQLDKRNPIFKEGHNLYQPELEPLGYLLDKGSIISGAPVIGLDMQGKFVKMMQEGKFLGKPVRVKDLWYPAEEGMLTMQDPRDVVGEIVKFLKAASQMKSGTAFIEDNQRLTNVIQTYVQYWLRDRPEHKELPLGHLPKYGYEDWGIRNSIWDFLGGYFQRLPIHLEITTPMEPVWLDGKPTGELEPKRYKQVPFYCDTEIWLWYTEDSERGIEYWSQIQHSDYTEPGYKFKVHKNPSIVKTVNEICMLSHSYELKRAGFVVDAETNIMKRVMQNGQKTSKKTKPATKPTAKRSS